jgi:DNA-binding SARP family transcriptional activator
VIRCRVLGPVEVTVDGAPAPAELLWRKHLALLIYLARSPKRTRTREHLTGLLWPEKDESAARHSLNEALHILRRAAGEEAVDTSASQVRLGADAVHLDADDLRPLLDAGALAEAAGMIAGEFLEGFSVPGGDALEDWLGAERRHWRLASLAALLAWSESLLAQGRASDALATARRAQALDPHSDPVIRAVMSALAVQGDIAAGLGEFESFRARLARDVGAEPAEATRALAGRLRHADGPRAAARTARPRPAGGEQRRAPLVGRGQELGLMLGVWEQARGGGGAAAILLEGESGTGKSRLLEEFVSRTRISGAAIAEIRAVEADADEPGSGVLGLARGGLLDAPGLPGAPPQAVAHFARALPEWAERFPAAAGTADPFPPALALAAVLGAALGDGPLVLAVDDAHWMDRASLLGLLAALRDLARGPLCFVFAAVPEPPHPGLDEVRRQVGRDIPGVTLTLGPLSGDALRELAAWALPGCEPVRLERICRRVASDSAGLPFLAVELLSAVAAGLDLQQGVAGWPAPMHTLSQTLPGDLPDSVTAALRVGFRRLSHDAQELLTAAAVVGDGASEALLGRATGLPAAALPAALDELEWQRWLEADSRGYSFVARLARQVVARDMLTPGRRARLRERAGLAPAS